MLDDTEDNLIFSPDDKGNNIPDFSYVGYHHSEREIPIVAVVKTISAVDGDNLANIQNAIDALEALEADENGHRGALLLKSGTYCVSDVLKIEKSGIVLRGEGNTTKLIATKKTKSNFIEFNGSSNPRKIQYSQQRITNTYVPVGSRKITVENAKDYSVGEAIMIERQPNHDWIKLLGMDDLKKTDTADSNWSPEKFTISYRRKIVRVDGNQITIDAPMVDIIDQKYAKGFVYKYNWKGKIEEVGIENLRLDSYYASEDDEAHAWNAVSFNNVMNGWAKKVYANFFTYSCINIGRSSMKITVDGCEMRNHKGLVRGGRMYSFNILGEQNLIKNCTSEGGRHSYVTGSTVAGPNVFLNCRENNAKSVTGPHHRWTTGLLFDNVVILGDDISVENRRNSGSGHGWAAATCMFWNCTANKIIIQDPPGDHTNWAIGCTGVFTNRGCCGAKQPYGNIKSRNQPVTPNSLFKYQLANRLGIPLD
ncbi:MAG: hypothetical protein WBG71_13855 [Leeuwenhoekiella sp.]